MIWSVGQFLRQFKVGFMNIKHSILDLLFASKNWANVPTGLLKKWSFSLVKLAPALVVGALLLFVPFQGNLSR